MSPKSGIDADQHTDADVHRHPHQRHVGHAANPRRERNDQRQQPGQHVAQPGNQTDNAVDAKTNARARNAKRLVQQESRACAGSRRGRSTRRDSSDPLTLRRTCPESPFAAAIHGVTWCMLRGSLEQVAGLLFDATIDRVHGGYSSAAERLTVAQDVVGSIPTSRPNVYLYYLVRFTGFEVLWWANMGQARCNSCRVPRPLKTSPPRL